MNDDVTLNIATCTFNPTAKPGQETFKKTDARSISGWLDVSVTRGIERCPSSFDVSYTEPYPSVGDILAQPGDWVQVMLGDDLVLTGFVDRYMPSYSGNQHSVRITGRSKCQDLVDCAAYINGGQLLNMTVDKIAAALCAPYGIGVSVAAGTDVGKPIEQVNVMVGETSYAVLELLCRYRALLLYDTPDGSLQLASGGNANTTGPVAIGTRVAASGFTEGINVMSASLMLAMDGRFSQYDAAYQGLDTLRDIGNGGNIISHTYDATVPRFRYRAIISENVTGGVEIALQRAQWEMAYRYGRSFQVRLVTDSWRDSAGMLYEPNVLVDIDLPSLKLSPRRWLISEVAYKKGPEGTSAELTIMPPQAFYQEPIILNPVGPDFTRVSQ
ncbi:Mu P family protein [Burkholderia cenocepacia]|uniref:phage baseplate assembly protein n=1 Tax=Burkholderia cenocepacia TaxID=95486 RepID=UPI0022307C44|nr:Mu P family protein [Burkholderia cenocepacia]MCW3644118.1 Mu P family protein [Burkholderia cenocepacia]